MLCLLNFYVTHHYKRKLKLFCLIVIEEIKVTMSDGHVYDIVEML